MLQEKIFLDFLYIFILAGEVINYNYFTSYIFKTDKKNWLHKFDKFKFYLVFVDALAYYVKEFFTFDLYDSNLIYKEVSLWQKK